MYDHLVRPRKRSYFVVPAVSIIIGMVVYFAWRSYIIENWTDYATPYVFPGSHPIEFQEAGGYLVLYEYATSIGDKYSSSSPDITDLSVDIGGAFGTTVPIISKASRSIKVGDRLVTLVTAFMVTHPDRVQFSAGYRSGKLEPEFVLSVMRSGTLESFLWTGYVAAAFLFLGFIIAALSPIIIWRKRKKSRMQLAHQFSRTKSRTVI